MQIQILSPSNQTLFRPRHSPRNFDLSFSPLHYLGKVFFDQSSKSGLCNSIKRLSKSLTSSANDGGSVSVRCSQMQNDDAFYIRRCVELAKKAIGCTSPNPMVGSVIVKDGKIVGEGYHPKAGQPHAEVFSLRDAGDLAENATAYVSLEPCSHYGKTPPCSEALIKAKVKRVVVGMVDPNPIVDSKGLDRLRSAGIDVTVGVEEELCKKLNEAFIHKMLTGKPFMTLSGSGSHSYYTNYLLTLNSPHPPTTPRTYVETKILGPELLLTKMQKSINRKASFFICRYSIAVNGHLLDQLGEGVTDSGGYYSQLLQEYDAVIFSASLMQKFGLPASREPGANQPLQIITASNSSSIEISGLPEETTPKMVVITDKEMNVEPETAKRGIDTVVMEQISLNEILEYCKRQGFCSVLIDLRGSYEDLEILLKEGIEENLLQKIVVEVLPVWSDGDGGQSVDLLNSLGRRLKVKNLQPKVSSQSLVLEGYFQCE